MASPHKTWSGISAAIVVTAAALIASAQGPLGPPRPVVPAQPLPGGLAPPNAQQPGPQRVTANRPVQVMDKSHDQVVADWLLIGNNEEVQMAKLAGTHAEHKSVKDFADKMEHQHAQAEQQLERFAGRAAQATIRARMQPGEMHFLTVQQQIAEQCLATASKDMGAKTGIDFDRAYMGCQIGSHYRMIDTMKVLREYASPELSKVINDQIQVAQTHLDRAKEIERDLISNNSSSK